MEGRKKRRKEKSEGQKKEKKEGRKTFFIIYPHLSWHLKYSYYHESSLIFIFGFVRLKNALCGKKEIINCSLDLP